MIDKAASRNPKPMSHNMLQDLYMKNLSILFTFMVTVFSSVQSLAEGKQTLRVYAAASLNNAMSEISAHYQQSHTNIDVHLVFAGSSTLARQIEAGAPADIFISADQKWIRYLSDKQLLSDSSIINLLSNTLVVISPENHGFKFEALASFDFASAFDGYLCAGHLTSVPAGRYAKESLIHFDWLDTLQGRIVETNDVRSALAFVERGECAAGIIYATDAAITQGVKVLGKLPNNSHSSIIYPAAITIQAVNKPAVAALFRYITTSQEALDVFTQYAFPILTVSP